MVNDALTIATAAGLGPELLLAIRYVPVESRSAVAALLALDRRLGDILRTTREPLIGQMRMCWWRETLVALSLDRAAPAEPVMTAIREHLLPSGIDGRRLAGMVDGWEVIVGSANLDDRALVLAAEARGATLFALAADLLSADDPQVAAAGRGWALADFSLGLSDPGAATRAAALARSALDGARACWSRKGRPLGALAALARADLAGTPPGSPRRVARLLRMRLTGW